MSSSRAFVHSTIANRRRAKQYESREIRKAQTRVQYNGPHSEACEIAVSRWLAPVSSEASGPLRRAFAALTWWLARERETEPSIWLEKQVFVVRWLGIAFITPVLLLFPIPPDVRLYLF